MNSAVLPSLQRAARKASRTKNISLEKSKSKITLMSCIAWIRSYMEDNGMGTVFLVYDTDLKTEVYLLDE